MSSPFDIHSSERAVLGCLCMDSECLQTWKTYAAKVKNPRLDLIHGEYNRVTLDAILELYEKGIQPDFTCLIDWLNSTHRLGDAGGPSRIIQFSMDVWSTKNCGDYIKILYDRYRREQLNRARTELEEATTAGVDVNTSAVKFSETVKKLIESTEELETPNYERMSESCERLLVADDSSERVLPTSFPAYARMTGGHVRGQIELIGAPPGNGKTAWVMQEIDHILANSSAVVDAFLMESDMDQFLARAAGRNYGINLSKFNPNNKSFTHDERMQVAKTAKRLAGYENRLFMRGPGVYNASEIAAMVRQRRERTGLPSDLIVVDYLQRMGAARAGYSATDHKSFHENIEVLFKLCAEENAAMIVLSQLTMDDIRNSFNKKTQRPGMGAFKGSGAPIEAAKVAMILYKNDQDMLNERVVEQQFVICKANNGAQGIVRSLFIKPLAFHIEDETPSDRAPYSAWLGKHGYDAGSPRKDKQGKAM